MDFVSTICFWFQSEIDVIFLISSLVILGSLVFVTRPVEKTAFNDLPVVNKPKFGPLFAIIAQVRGSVV